MKSRLSVSLTMRNKPMNITSKIPDDMMPCSTSNGSFLPPLTASNKIKANVPPSRAGNGNRLITARFRFSNAANWYSPSAFDFATSAPTAHGMSEMLEVHGEEEADSSMTVTFNQFLAMFDDPDWGFGIMSTILKLEGNDRNRHGNHVCSVCRYPIIGSRFKEVKARFSLCNQCYSEGKVPPSFKQEEYKFREYGSEAEAMKAKCVCFSMQSHKKPIAT